MIVNVVNTCGLRISIPPIVQSVASTLRRPSGAADRVWTGIMIGGSHCTTGAYKQRAAIGAC